MYSDLEILNPKRSVAPSNKNGKALFSYYAGYSSEFSETLIDSLALPSGSLILDPWNGSGTTTNATIKCGLSAVGTDLNPVMVIIAKASLVSKLDVDSLVPLGHSIVRKAETLLETKLACDPLERWFCPSSSLIMRQIETSINNSLLSSENYRELKSDTNLSLLTPIAAFYYLCLFRVIRKLAKDFIPSNPTWIRAPKSSRERKRPSPYTIKKCFLDEINLLAENYETLVDTTRKAPNVSLRLCNSESLPISSESVDAVITSPPYCTRIDYAVATYVELAALRIGEEEFDVLRRSLTGTSTVRDPITYIPEAWGPTCEQFLRDLYSHPSKASKTYYYKNHAQYFNSLHKSLSEISRVLKTGSTCTLVVQNSHYKEIYTDIATICTEMLDTMSLSLFQKKDFSASRTMASLNKNSKKYKKSRGITESVLCFKKRHSLNPSFHKANHLPPD